MAGYAQGRFPGFRRSLIGGGKSPIWYLLPNDENTHTWDSSPYFNTVRFSMLPLSGSALSIPLGPFLHNRAALSCRKRWTDWRGRSAVTFQSACREMNFPFVRNREN